MGSIRHQERETAWRVNLPSPEVLDEPCHRPRRAGKIRSGWGALLCVLLAALGAHAQDTAYPPQDAQIAGPPSKADFPAWLADVQHWRRERLMRVGYDGTNYTRPELKWTQRNFICVQMMIEEQTFFDPTRGVYTVDAYLDRLKQEFGGVDSVLIWDTYPNLGVDNRNQFDRLRDMPGGIEDVREVVAAFHRRGVHVFFPETPWDMGTRNEGVPDWTAQAQLMKAVGADGLMGDTLDGMPYAYLKASDAVGHPLALHPEGIPPDETLAWNEMTWGYWSYPFIPMISRYKWLERRHMPMLVSGGLHHIPEIQAGFFNGVGVSDQEDVIGIHDGFTARELEALRRTTRIKRTFADAMVSAEWEPYTPTLQYGVFAGRFPGNTETVWTLINRNPYAVGGRQIEVRWHSGTHYYDLWHGEELKPEISGSIATLSFAMGPDGFGAVLATNSADLPQPLQDLLAEMRAAAAKPLSSYSDGWQPLQQQIVPIAPAKADAEARRDMVRIPGGAFRFQVHGIEVNVKDDAGLDVQEPWERVPRRFHDHVMTVPSFYIDRYPVTNSQYKAFLDATRYHPRDDHDFLRDWHDGTYPEGWGKRPVTWVSLEDARAYARWAGKRLPHEWEWQYAAQGADGRIYPWGNQWDAAAVPVPDQGRTLTGPAEVIAHPQGASPFGVMDMVGNVWQWTDEFDDTHTRSAILRGGSYYQPQGSMWYFPQAYRLDEHGKYLLMAPSIDRSGTIGFRCAADADE
ncbi:MAG TPA: SUMF1/EgtB/PvdO family nonheme iron enzyme [Acidobacteriaceae bacterium]|nr:SUMF1/EgtB/PvdO family nonheme iron enzyme [Acidobacteriaceae bacterium]